MKIFTKFQHKECLYLAQEYQLRKELNLLKESQFQREIEWTSRDPITTLIIETFLQTRALTLITTK